MEILESVNNGKHFHISSGVIFLSMVKFMTKICYWIEACFHGPFLQKYGTKGFGNSIYMYLVLYVVGVI